MLKSSVYYTLVIGFLFFAALNVHLYFLEKETISLQFSLKGVYLFHAVFTLLVCVGINYLSSLKKIFDQLGLIYFGALILKIVIFYIIFNNSIISAENLSKIERISLLIPMAIFLVLEVYFIARILNRK